MISALYRYPKSERKAAASRWGKRSAEVKAARRIANGPDAETVRQRALYDRRGIVVRALYSANSCVTAVHSLRGRTDQYDVMVDGVLSCTRGPRRLPEEVR